MTPVGRRASVADSARVAARLRSGVTDDILQRLLSDPDVIADPVAVELAHVVSAPTGLSSAGFPYLSDDAFARFRDRVPHILAMGPRALAALDVVTAAARRAGADVAAAARVVRGCVLTAAVTAPPDLWLVRHVAGCLARTGVVQRLLAGETVDASACDVVVAGGTHRADARELEADLTLLVSRGLVQVAPSVDGERRARFVAPRHPRARETLAALSPLPPSWPADVSRLWWLAFADAAERSAGGRSTMSGLAVRPLDDDERAVLVELGASARTRTDAAQDTWIPTAVEVEVGFRLVPVVLGLRAAGMHARLAEGAALDAAALCPGEPAVGAAALAILEAAGVVMKAGGDGGGGPRFLPTATGKRVGDKGAGPMGIIEAYHPYMAHLDDILVHGRGGAAWVTRGANIAASQDANRDTFQRANDALDAYCADTGFSYEVYIEHAIGRGEATRQRFEKDGERVRYFGADLEDAAIDACLEEQARGVLPRNMVFVRHADIGDPQPLVDAVRKAGCSTEGAVMIVGNGFHEVRGKDDDGMVGVFRAYCDAGIVLLFTEENALRVDDLLATAWNTYHAGFRYVHDKSGQGLRPAEPALPSTVGRSLHSSWRECAERAGYVRMDKYSSKSRTVYPLARKGRANPTISASHFCVPARLVRA